MTDSSRPKGLALIPPPLMFVAPLLIGLWLNGRFPLLRPAASMPKWLEWIGIALIAAGIAHTLTSVILFVTSRTTVIPHRHASTFVQRGAYRWTRNPMYVGLTLIYIGICAITTALLPLLLLPIPLLFLDRLVIPMEERHMTEVFGADYVDYQTRVRRWL